MSLKNIVLADQEELKSFYRFAVRTGRNLIALGPSGAGKTEMAMQALEEEKLQCVYWNLSVSERPDIQGLPRVSDDGQVSTYAAPVQFPMHDTRFYNERESLKRVLEHVDGREKKVIQDRLEKISKYEQSRNIMNALPYVERDSEIEKLLKNQLSTLKSQISDMNTDNIGILFDEVDKCPPEIAQPLLEGLQFRKINGKEICAKAMILTGNLPEEHAGSEPLSHAITNRCMIVQLKPRLDIWRKWAVRKNIHPSIISFLSKDENAGMFSRPPENNDIHAYAYPTPRSWTEASKILYDLEKDNRFWSSELSKDMFSSFSQSLIASKIGEQAALHFQIWADYYQKLDPLITQVIEGRGEPSLKDLNLDEVFVLAIGISSRFAAMLKKYENNPKNKEVHKTAKHVFGWLDNLNRLDIVTGTVRSVFDVDLLSPFQFQNTLPEMKSILKKSSLITEENDAV